MNTLDIMHLLTRRRNWELAATRARDEQRAFICGFVLGIVPAVIVVLFMFALSGH